MDLASLTSTLQLCLSQHPQERKLGEDRLNQFRYLQGHLVSLLQTIVSQQVDLAIRQAAAIHFKNLVAKEWEIKEGEPSKFTEEDRKVVRDNLVEAIIQAPQLLRVQLGECCKSIILEDYPERWPELLLIIQNNLKAEDPKRMYGGLFAMRILARKYEFKEPEERVPMQFVVNSTFPLLLALFQGLLSLSNPPIEVAELLKLICKIFWSSCYLEIPALVVEPSNCHTWMTCFHNLLERPVPVEGQPIDSDLRKNWGWWKVKKWVLHIVNRLFNRFGDPKLVTGDAQVQFARAFQKNYAGRFLQSYLVTLNTLRQGGYLPDRVINLAMQYLTISIPKSSTYSLMKVQLEVILFEIAFPLMCFNDSDAELWIEDPHEYVRKGYDIIEDMYSPRTAAINFISELVRKRGKENLPRFVNFIVDVFRIYQESPPESKPYRQKDGALLAIGSLADRLKQQDPYKGALEQMLVQHVLPEFQNPLGHLRAKAAWVAGQYADISFQDQRNFNLLLQCIVNSLRDPDLPVRVDSVVALRSFVDATDELDDFRPIIPQLLDEFFKLINEVENEDLVFTLETIVDKFGEEMAPYALGLCQNLAAAFWRCIKTADEDEEGDEDDMGALAAVGCLRAISTILESISSLPQLYPQIEPILLPIMRKMLTTDGQDVYEEVLELVSYITYFSPKISLDMWSLWPLMIAAVDEWAIDYFENILVPLDNYISRDTDNFLSAPGTSYPQDIFKLVVRVLEDEKISDVDAVPAPKLLETVLQNCRGRVDEWVEPYLSLAVRRFRKTDKLYLKDLLMEVVANALHYNPTLCLQVLQKLGCTGEVFQAWMAMIYATIKLNKPAHFKREHDKKVCCLGLNSLLLIPETHLPPEVQAGLPQVVKGLLKLLVAYKDQREENEKAAQETDDGEVEDSDEGGYEAEELGEDGDEGTEGDSEVVRKLASHAKEFSWNADDDDSDDDDWIEDEEFSSPIDNIDPIIFFADSMNSLSASDPRRFQMLTGGMDFSQQAICHGLAQHADVRRQEMAKQEAQKAAEAQNAQQSPLPLQ